MPTFGRIDGRSAGVALLLLMLALGAWLAVAAFIHVHSDAEAARLLLLALPLVALLFTLFPRLPGPIWGLPGDEGGSAARTGVSDSMAPGSIAALARSAAVVTTAIALAPATGAR